MIPQAQQWKVIKALYETTHYECEALWNLLQRLLVGKEMKMVFGPEYEIMWHVFYQNNPGTVHPLLHYLDPFNTKETENWHINFTQVPKSEDTSVY